MSLRDAWRQGAQKRMDSEPAFCHEDLLAPWHGFKRHLWALVGDISSRWEIEDECLGDSGRHSTRWDER